MRLRHSASAPDLVGLAIDEVVVPVNVGVSYQVRYRVVTGQSIFGRNIVNADIRSLRNSRFLLAGTIEMLVAP